MLFSTWQFALVFLPITLFSFFLIPSSARAARKAWLTLASLFFYAAWKVEYLPLLLFSMGFNFAVAEALCRWRGRPAARLVLTAGVAGNLLLLGYFKYTNFVLEMLGLGLGRPAPHFDIVLPLAISFFTFTQISYIVDVSRDPKLHYGLLDYTLFVSFFPHLIAGPIVRHWEIIPQYAERDLRLTRANLAVGLTLFLMGLGKKVLLADEAAAYADGIFGAAQGGAVPWFNAWFGTLAFALQIYFDFSGYSDMAIGLARLFDLKFPCNFNSPYQAANINEFWQRWHMTLTRFLREYVYIPLGGNRRGFARQATHVMITFFLSGLWHGANWTFVAWGLLHGCLLVAYQAWVRLRQKTFGGAALGGWPGTMAARLVTFAVVLVTWVYFRAPSIEVANRMLLSMAGAHGFAQAISLPGFSPWAWVTSLLGSGAHGFAVDARALAVIGPQLVVAWFAPNSLQLLARYSPALEGGERAARRPLTLGFGWGAALGLVAFLVVRSQATSPPSPFLYFNF